MDSNPLGRRDDGADQFLDLIQDPFKSAVCFFSAVYGLLLILCHPSDHP